jgi:pyridoxal phosphate enzyme (YggS family)
MSANVRANLASVQARIASATAACGRDPSSVRLVAVSKTKTIDAIREAYGAGQRDFGENYAQELAEKAKALADLDGLRWHFIGHMQSNKAKLIAPVCVMVHSVDTPSLAKELGKRAAVAHAGAGRTLDALVEVNVGGESTKSGCTPSDIEEVCAAIEAQPALRLRGVMTMPPPGDLDAARKVFETLVSLRNIHGGPKRLPELSMGMTGDLEIAIACGATIVRVGTAIFGER